MGRGRSIGFVRDQGFRSVGGMRFVGASKIELSMTVRPFTSEPTSKRVQQHIALTRKDFVMEYISQVDGVYHCECANRDHGAVTEVP